MFATSIKRQIISGEDDFGRVRKVLWSSSLVTWDTIGQFRQIYHMISSVAPTDSFPWCHIQTGSENEISDNFYFKWPLILPYLVTMMIRISEAFTRGPIRIKIRLVNFRRLDTLTRVKVTLE